ncbi:lipid-A-disaccharide synthase [Pararhizobium mangrovi]|uniref:Lipid-A-disaccharide synthase n=1 Tax=Pararhizobium mangrovi TaxID=2590452 RepID=A0A506UE47_9HYPH|nr:lipid-A-disaccharide synthase [Pararhizobium mangrovi]TPW31224.1 lipid-A-disaccharide synthase [Pararhizobium mangrovi]
MSDAGEGRKLRKVAIVAGESSGDALGAALIAALRKRVGGDLELMGVGGEAMEAKGLRSLFDYHVFSIVGASAIVTRLPVLLLRIRQTADAIIRERPDMLVIIDSPGFTHRVARRVRRHLPDVPIIDYVCPTVWAWKPRRAGRMVAYVDHVLAVLPFEPEIVTGLGGPPITYVGHSLVEEPALVETRRNRSTLDQASGERTGQPVFLLLPGSRLSELKRHLPVMRDMLVELGGRYSAPRFVLPAVRRHEERIRTAVADWPVKPEVVVGPERKWKAFAEADAAVAASGTVLLELALAGVPCVSIYKLDPLARLLVWRITAWSAALPNMIADYPVIAEYMNETVRPGRLARWLERLAGDTLQRRAMIEGFACVRERMETARPPSEHAADIVLDVFAQKQKRSETR